MRELRVAGLAAGRSRMLGMLAAEAAEGRGCCDLPNLGAPVGGDSPGICEFQG